MHFCKKSFDMYVAKAIYALLAHICRESVLRTFGTCMSRKRITHSVRKVFARKSLPTGNLGLFRSLEEAKHHLAVGWHEAKLFVLDHNPCWTPVIQTCLGGDRVFWLWFRAGFSDTLTKLWLVLIGCNVAPWWHFLQFSLAAQSNVLCFVQQTNNGIWWGGTGSWRIESLLMSRVGGGKVGRMRISVIDDLQHPPSRD